MAAEKSEKRPIAKDMIIGDLVQKYPESVEIMLGYGLHCVGCRISPFESIEAGAKVHGLSDEVIDKLIEDLNRLAEKKPTEEEQEEKDF